MQEHCERVGESERESGRKIGTLTVKDGNDNHKLMGMNGRHEGTSNAPRNIAVWPPQPLWLPTPSPTNIGLPHANEIDYAPQTGASLVI